MTVTGGGVPSSARGQRRPLLPPFRPPRPPARTSHAIAEEHSQIDESQPLLTPEVPVAEVVNTGRRVVQSQLTASTGLDDEVPSDNSDDDDVDADDEENNGNNLADWFATTRSNNAGGGGDEYEDDLGAGESSSRRNEMHGFSSGNEFELNERCRYYMDGASITPQNRQAVEFVYMIEALTLVRGENTMRRSEMWDKVINRYKLLIRAIPDKRFSQFDLQNAMIARMHNSKVANGSAKGLYDKAEKVKACVQLIIQQIPTLPKLPSGRDIFDVRNDFILREYKKEMGKVCLNHCSLFYVMQRHTNPLCSMQHPTSLQEFCDKYLCDQDIKDDMPSGWWITTPKQQKGKKKVEKRTLYLLAALVHRNNPDCIPDATDAEAGDTRDVIRKKVKDQRSTEVEAAKRAPQTKKGQIEESIMSTKAALMEQTKELQDIQGVKEQLMMMEKFKSSFVNLHNKSGDGDAEYDETVCDLLYQLPIVKKRKAMADGVRSGDGGSSRGGRTDGGSVTSSAGN